jgi:hypothetical protein
MEPYRPRLVSANTLAEVYKLSLEREGKDTADTGTARIRKEFGVVPVNDSIAIRGAYPRKFGATRTCLWPTG